MNKEPKEWPISGANNGNSGTGMYEYNRKLINTTDVGLYIYTG